LYALLPILYLRGISTGDFQDALSALTPRTVENGASCEARPRQETPQAVILCAKR
jgi:hypothetical protein